LLNLFENLNHGHKESRRKKNTTTKTKNAKPFFSSLE